MAKRKAHQHEEVDPLDERNQMIDALIGSSFQLSATGTVFTIGTEANPSWEDIIFTLNRLYSLGYVDEFNLLPFNVEPAILVSSLSKDTVSWLVPLLIQSIDRKVMSGQIDVLADNNSNLVRLADVLGWYWYHHLHGPKPVINSMLRFRKEKLVLNVALVCPLCYHQFIPAPGYKTQSAKAFAFAKWLPTHFRVYHRYKDTSKTNKRSACHCGFCTGKYKLYTADVELNKKGGTK